MSPCTRVLLADDHALVRAGVRALLQAMPDVDVVAEANDGREALELIRARRPHVAVLAIGLPGLNGLELATQVMRELDAVVRIVLLTMHPHLEYVRHAVRSHVTALLLKDGAPSELRLAIEAAMRGETYVAPSISRAILDGYRARGVSTRSPVGLTRAQGDVLELLTEGLATQEIAYLLNLRAETVEALQTELLERLRSRERSQGG